MLPLLCQQPLKLLVRRVFCDLGRRVSRVQPIEWQQPTDTVVVVVVVVGY